MGGVAVTAISAVILKEPVTTVVTILKKIAVFTITRKYIITTYDAADRYQRVNKKIVTLHIVLPMKKSGYIKNYPHE